MLGDYVELKGEGPAPSGPRKPNRIRLLFRGPHGGGPSQTFSMEIYQSWS